VEVGLASRGDRRGIFSLLEANGPPRDGLEKHLKATPAARETGRIVGGVAEESYGSYALLRSVAVDAEHRRLGRRLALAAIELARGCGASRAFLLTETAGDPFSRPGITAAERPAVPRTARLSVEFVSACPAGARAARDDLRGQGAG